MATAKSSSSSSDLEPMIGQVVHYKLGSYDLEQFNDRMSNLSEHVEGQVLPMIVTKVHEIDPDADTADQVVKVNGRVFLDGDHDLWVTLRKEGEGLSQWTPIT
jgi:hypothetical protein